jgi:DNA polymerase III subunit epsilon
MKEIVVVDIETSGFQQQGGLIVEVGMVSLNLETGRISDELNEIVRENGFGEKHARDPYGWIFKNSDLRYEEVLRSRDLLEIIPNIQSVFDRYQYGATAFNKQFDSGFLKSRGLRIKELPCIMLSAAPVVNLPPNPGYFDPKWPKVQEAWDFFFPGSGYIETHRALDDARHEALIAYELYKIGKFRV